MGPRRSVGRAPTNEELTAAELRAVYREAYMAVLPVCLREAHARDEDVQSTVREVGLYALETVRQWPAMTAERDALIAKAVQG